MKKVFLIFLMLLLPWQAFAAMERNLGHVIGGSQGSEIAVQHVAAHSEHVLHHHDDDDDSAAAQVDDSQKSVQHLADCEHAGSMNFLLLSPNAPLSAAVSGYAPALWRDQFRTRSVDPLLRPPRLPA